MVDPEASSYPYSSIIDSLLVSTMRAQHCLLDAYFGGEDIKEDRFAGEVNKHFSWLALVYRGEGVNRHFFDAPDGLKPLKTKWLRLKNSIPPEILERLDRRETPDQGLSEEDFDQLTYDKLKGIKRRYWQDDGTRISELIRRAVEEDIRESDLRAEKARKSGKKEEEFGFSIRSPLAIVFDLLTAPDMPGSRAYALLAVRNLLFSAFELAPSLRADSDDSRSAVRTFSIHDVESALSLTWTYVRPRYESLGADKLKVNRAGPVTLVLHYMAVKGIFRFRFGTRNGKQNCLEYLKHGKLKGFDNSKKNTESPAAPNRFELERSEYNEKLPEAGELGNELLGLPIPIRGADTVFRGGIGFAARKGLVIAIHGGPGTGKTSVALALGAYLSPFGIRTLFLSGEEGETDLKSRLSGLVPDGIRRLDFFPDRLEGDWIMFRDPFNDDLGESSSQPQQPKAHHDAEGRSLIDRLEATFLSLSGSLPNPSNPANRGDGFRIPKPCRAIVVFDGLHDLFANNSSVEQQKGDKSQLERLHNLVRIARKMEALVILTTGREWIGDARLDYLVDMSITLTHDSVDEYGAKPDRRLILSKARHQLCATGTHGLQIAGAKGVRFSPQINYQLDRRSIRKVRLPEQNIVRKVLFRVAEKVESLNSISDNAAEWSGPSLFIECPFDGARIFANSHVFINGQGSGGKAGLALKIAVAPSYDGKTLELIGNREKVLVVSFLYPKEYYEELLVKIQGRGIQERGIVHWEFGERARTLKPAKIEVIHLYPGHLKPNDLYNRIEWELDAAELNGDPYTCVLIDGIHNVFLQFPEIQRNSLFWPQIYNALRSRPIMTITTHTTLAIPKIVKDGMPVPAIDDGRSVPLRNALVQKTDFQIEVDPFEDSSADERLSRLFKVKVVAAIGQEIPKGHVLWSREKLVFVRDPSRSCGDCNGMPPGRDSSDSCPVLPRANLGPR